MVPPEPAGILPGPEEKTLIDASVLTILDLDTRQKQTISCGDSERLRYLGFLDEAAVYGIADTADINTAHAGLEFFPMKKVELVNGSGEVVKEYSCRKLLCDRCGHREEK